MLIVHRYIVIFQIELLIFFKHLIALKTCVAHLKHQFSSLTNLNSYNLKQFSMKKRANKTKNEYKLESNFLFL